MSLCYPTYPHALYTLCNRLDHVFQDELQYYVAADVEDVHVFINVQKLLTLTLHKSTQCVFPQNLFKAAKTITKVNAITTSGRTAAVQQTPPR